MSDRLFRSGDAMRHAPMGRRVAHEGGDWLHGLAIDQLGRDWDVFGTLTFETPRRHASVTGTVRQYAERLSYVTRQPVGVAFAIESHRSGAPHVHTLIAGARVPIRPEQVKRAWRKRGGAHAVPYDASGNAAHYIAKLGLVDWTLAETPGGTIA